MTLMSSIMARRTLAQRTSTEFWPAPPRLGDRWCLRRQRRSDRTERGLRRVVLRIGGILPRTAMAITRAGTLRELGSCIRRIGTLATTLGALRRVRRLSGDCR
jgi:hypothetical protein